MSDFDLARSGMSYMHWFGPATFLRCPLAPDFKDTDIGLIGVPYCGGNLIERMQYLGPRAVRNRCMGYARAHREFAINPFELMRIRDLGDAPLDRALNPDLGAEDIQAFFARVFAAGITPVSVGGDHSITWPILRAARATCFPAPLAMVHFDSHTDAYPEAGGTRNTAAGFRFGAEDGIIDPHRTVQIGIRGPMAALDQDNWAEQSGFRIIGTEEFVAKGVDHVIAEVRRVVGDAPAYLSFDLDALDPAARCGRPRTRWPDTARGAQAAARAARHQPDGGRLRLLLPASRQPRRDYRFDGQPADAGDGQPDRRQKGGGSKPGKPRTNLM